MGVENISRALIVSYDRMATIYLANSFERNNYSTCSANNDRRCIASIPIRGNDTSELNRGTQGRQSCRREHAISPTQVDKTRRA
jgi:hypothetical protein